jgi:hypothetical protein
VHLQHAGCPRYAENSKATNSNERLELMVNLLSHGSRGGKGPINGQNTLGTRLVIFGPVFGSNAIPPPARRQLPS